MTDNWDFYALRVDEQPASIFLDLGIQADAPMQALPYLVYIRLFMNQPRADGLSSQEEFDMLVSIEKSMEAKLCGDSAVYVGRNTSAGCRDFYFYVSSPEKWDHQVADLLAAFQGYRYETGSREDANWSVYLDFLCPGPIDRQRIENRRVCEALEHHGDPLTEAREIDHWSHFPDQSTAHAYLTETKALGFQVRSQAMATDGPLPHSIQVWRADVPSYQNIDSITLSLYEAAARHGGDYDGWECPVEA